MTEWKQDRVGAALRGENPTVLARLGASFAVIGDVQFLPGYCVAITDTSGIDRLTDLPRSARSKFLHDTELLAEAIELVCSNRDPRFRRVNIEILGNTDAFLHAHVWPRYEWEPRALVGKPVWLYPAENWSDPDTALSEAHDGLRTALTEQITELVGENG